MLYNYFAFCQPKAKKTVARIARGGQIAVQPVWIDQDRDDFVQRACDAGVVQR